MSNRKKWAVLILVSLMLLVAGMVTQAGQAQVPTPVQPPANETVRQVSVSGEGQVQASPDQAVIVLGVQTEAKEANQALTQNSQKMQALLGVLKNAGIPSSNIQTRVLQLRPRIENQPGQTNTNQQVTGYIATNTLEVKVSNLDKLGQILDAAVKAGGNTIQNIRFEVSDTSSLLDQARQEAMNNAQHKAEQLASLAGAQLGDVLTINETSQTPIPFVREAAQPAAQPTVPVEPGTRTVKVDIQVTWQLR